MNNIAGIPYVAVRFDKDGSILNQASVPAGTTDLIVISHGWNNSDADAEKLYRDLFTNFAAVAPELLTAKKLAIIGVIWPSKQFTDVVNAAVAEQAATGGGAAFGSGSATADATIIAKLDLVAPMFGQAGAAKIAEAKAQIAKLESDPAARDKFVETLRSLLDPGAANEEDNSKLFFKMSGSNMLEKLKMPTPLASTGSRGGGGAASLGGHSATKPAGGAAGLGDLFSGVKAGAVRFLNYLTYYEMKSRAGNVGHDGVAPLIDNLASQVQRIHLVGHSFGGRVVTA
ncbi:MAG: hypothetical protein M3Z22_03395, partial [Verrucomicrobiota bacterium]|nr:hypothetical protein [Verrucomicrobiota bacterium]